MPEIANFWEQFQFEVNGRPAKMRKVLRRTRPPASWTQSLSLYSHGYSVAFEQMIMLAIEVWPRMDYLQFPVFYLARHAAELSLKVVIEAFSKRSGLPMDAGKEHRLLELWRMALSQIAAAGFEVDGDWTEHCRKIIQHMHEGDPDGQRFRYPHNNAGKTYPYNDVELRELASAHANIRMWCECSIQMLDNEADVLATE